MTSFTTKIGRRLLRAVRPTYYRWLHGRRFPGHHALVRAMARWDRGLGDSPQDESTWDREYAEGKWAFLERPDELARYAVIAALVARLAPGGRLLDVGCGEGLLLDHLSDRLGAAGPASYTGIDLSSVAIERGRRREGPGARLLVADAETYQPDGPVDAVVFNESVYYFAEPEVTVAHYRAALAPGGIAVVSMFVSPRTRALGRSLDRHWPPREVVEVRHGKGAWRISVHGEPVRPPGANGA